MAGPRSRPTGAGTCRMPPTTRIHRQQPRGPNPEERVDPARAWQDNGNFIVDCDLRNPAAQNNLARGGDNCGALTGKRELRQCQSQPDSHQPGHSARVGRASSRRAAGVSIQQQLLPRVSLDASYNRRWFKNFFVDDNRLVGPSDYTPWTFTAPPHPDLPDGGGYPVTVYSRLRRSARRRIGRSRRISATRARSTWHGVNVSVNARLANGLTFQGGTSTGRGVRDTCDTSKNLPETILNGHGHIAIDAGCSVPRDRAGDDVLQGPCRVHRTEDRRPRQRTAQIAEPEQHRRRRRWFCDQRCVMKPTSGWQTASCSRRSVNCQPVADQRHDDGQPAPSRRTLPG